MPGKKKRLSNRALTAVAFVLLLGSAPGSFALPAMKAGTPFPFVRAAAKAPQVEPVDKLKEAGDLEGLIRLLGDKDKKVAKAASMAIESMGAGALEPLFMALDNEDLKGSVQKCIKAIGIPDDLFPDRTDAFNALYSKPVKLSSAELSNVSGDRFVYSDADKKIIAVNLRTGKDIWSHEVEYVSSPLAASDGIVVFGEGAKWGNKDHRVTALDLATGSLKWSFPLKSYVRVEPVVTGRTVVVATETNRIMAIDGESGKALWEVQPGLKEPTSLVRGGDMVFVTGKDYTVRAMKIEDGKTVWKLKLPVFGSQFQEDLANAMYEKWVKEGKPGTQMEKAEWIAAKLKSIKKEAVETSFDKPFLHVRENDLYVVYRGFLVAMSGVDGSVRWSHLGGGIKHVMATPSTIAFHHLFRLSVLDAGSGAPRWTKDFEAVHSGYLYVERGVVYYIGPGAGKPIETLYAMDEGTGKAQVSQKIDAVESLNGKLAVKDGIVLIKFWSAIKAFSAVDPVFSGIAMCDNEALIADLLANNNDRVRKYAMIALARSGGSAKLYMKLLEDKSRDVRRLAIEELGKSSGKNVVAKLIKSMEEDEPNMFAAYQALEALDAKWKAKAAKETLAGVERIEALKKAIDAYDKADLDLKVNAYCFALSQVVYWGLQIKVAELAKGLGDKFATVGLSTLKEELQNWQGKANAASASDKAACPAQQKAREKKFEELKALYNSFEGAWKAMAGQMLEHYNLQVN
ncbi:MAG: PQQ-binding-like beta-propeller repeat protein [Pseudomonadota bacterium]